MSSKPQKLDKKDWHLFSKSRAYRGEMSFCLCYSFLSAVCSVVFKPVFRLGTFQNWLASWKKLIKSQRSCSIYSKIVTVTVKCLLFLLIFLVVNWYCFFISIFDCKLFVGVVSSLNGSHCVVLQTLFYRSRGNCFYCSIFTATFLYYFHKIKWKVLFMADDTDFLWSIWLFFYFFCSFVFMIILVWEEEFMIKLV